MPLESRNRTVSFRLTADEYDHMRELCYSNGVRSVSEMARAALKMMFERRDDASEQTLELRVAELESRFQLLTNEVRKLSQRSLLPTAADAQ